MDHTQPMQAAREHLQTHGWIGRHSEAFRHLPPPALAQWIDTPADDDTSPTDGGWHVEPIGDTPAGRYEARLLSALDAAERAELLADLPPPGSDEAAPFAWAHRALCRQGLRLRVHAAGAGATGPQTVWLQLRHQPTARVEAPLLVLDVADGVRCIVVEIHEHAAGQPALTQNLQAHVRLGRGAWVQHLRIAAPAAEDQVAHDVYVRLAE